jgi:hypothetical protein
MESIICNVRDIDAGDRHAIEHVVGRQLRDNQRLIIQLAEIDFPAEESITDARPQQTLEDWTGVYAGLTDAEVEEIDKIVKSRANMTRYLDLP